jgi:small-conductance mechanosensitive channel
MKNIEKFATKVDRFGVFVFVFIIAYSVFKLKEDKDLMTFILLLMGIGGFVVDSYIVYNTRGKK